MVTRVRGSNEMDPHHVNTTIYKDYGLTKEIALLMMGSTLEDYYPPLRVTIINRLKIHQSVSIIHILGIAKSKKMKKGSLLESVMGRN